MQLQCPGCGGDALHRFLFRKNHCDVIQCQACGLGRAIARGFEPEKYYNGNYFNGGQQDGYADYPSCESVLRREFARTIKFIREHVPDGRLLEIGCAYGFFLKEAAPYFDVMGIELCRAASQSCRDGGLNVVTGPADERVLSQFGKVDVVVMLDVIEHLPDPTTTLALCANVLSPDGLIVVTTGDFSSLCARVSGRRWRLMTPPQHLWYFTPKSMRCIGGASGLRLVACDYPGKLVPLSLIRFQLSRLLGGRPKRVNFGNGIGIPINMHDAMRCTFRPHRNG
jgi:SAM-dependent methyltransferase